MYKIIIGTIIAFSILLASCQNKQEEQASLASKVELRNINDTYRLYVNDTVFYVNGAGLEFGDVPNLASHGANSFRTWRTENGQKTGKEVLDEALENNLMVLMGIDILRERHGFDYDNTAEVQKQFEAVKKQILEHKDHPALLGWAIGNELNLGAKNKKVWQAVNDISIMIHEIDGNHPTTTPFAGFSKENAADYIKYCTDLDFVSIQMYGDIINLHKYLKEIEYDAPYMVTEWGATGHWEMPSTEWNIPIEQTSSEKAISVKERWAKAIAIDQKNCLGSYVFLWGQKQERTPTWYGLFTENGNETEVIDVMHEIWNGKLPDNQTPKLSSILLDEKTRFDNIHLQSNSQSMLKVISSDPDSDELSMKIEILADVTENFGHGGDKEKRPNAVLKTETIPYTTEFSFPVPKEAGPYRIFVYVTDGNNNVATANIPFLVTEKVTNDK